ncbi:hypothetical protein ACMFMG_012188 [Clarireedia jacksonii]
MYACELKIGRGKKSSTNFLWYRRFSSVCVLLCLLLKKCWKRSSPYVHSQLLRPFSPIIHNYPPSLTHHNLTPPHHLTSPQPPARLPNHPLNLLPHPHIILMHRRCPLGMSPAPPRLTRLPSPTTSLFFPFPSLPPKIPFHTTILFLTAHPRRNVFPQFTPIHTAVRALLIAIPALERPRGFQRVGADAPRGERDRRGEDGAVDEVGVSGCEAECGAVDGVEVGEDFELELVGEGG